MSASQLSLVIVIGALIAIGLALFLPLRRSSVRSDAPTGSPRSAVINRDDDRYWRGFIYDNPDDPSPFVPKRYGLGWTINFGHPQGKLILFVILALALLPIALTAFGVLPANTGSPGCHPFSGCHY